MILARRLMGSLAVVAVVAVAGCGGDDGSAGGRTATGTATAVGSTTTASTSPNTTDGAFVRAMVPHHESAVAMARIAQRRAEHAEVRRLAKDIIKTQRVEIRAMRHLADELRYAGVLRGDLGMSAKDMGMDGDVPMLRDAEPFDRMFLDMMVPHHEGAIAMARRELANGRHPSLRRMAQLIIDAQAREIAQMRLWREQWYGSAGKGEHTMPDGSEMHG